MRVISPSLLSADFSILSQQIKLVEDLGINRLHIDVMDGHFVPNFTFGPFILKAIRKLTNSHLETHLMMNSPENYIDEFIDAGADTLIIHTESSKNIVRDLVSIKDKGVNCGLALKPRTDESILEKYIDIIDYILVMSVEPGFGGQDFMPDMLPKMKNIVEMVKDREILVGVDGGVNIKTIDSVYETGVDITVVGSGLYKAQNIEERYNELMYEK
ncbi:MAG: ribulose-phosphate 3-epimerase [Candidatus Marinimicrobia bacterium]|nr:ribulose-phosphate 3-epimerase [Candidatus Neomarinimicrobiota bacterium]|tara:strand:- start:543 stop:1187 length:645 start_codon:yes stop_codon:yes gene_type:complete